MVRDFGPEAQQAVNGTTQAAFSNYRVRFIKPDIAVVDALLTCTMPTVQMGRSSP